MAEIKAMLVEWAVLDKETGSCMLCASEQEAIEAVTSTKNDLVVQKRLVGDWEDVPEPIVLPATQHLVVDTLVARHRLGEQLWTFPTSCKQAADALDKKGYIDVHSGTTENTFRASLTEKGRRAFMLASYVPPSLK